MNDVETRGHALARLLITPRLRAGEDKDDVIAGALHLANRRAQALGRPTRSTDLVYTLSIFCFWPVKIPPPARVREVLTDLRGPAFRGAARGEVAALDRLVPPATLTASVVRLTQLQRQDVSTFLNTGTPMTSSAT